MNIKLSERVQRIKPSPTLAVTAHAKQLVTEGRDIISLGVGEPDFDTPDHIKLAAIDAMQAGKTKYTPVDGTLALKNAIIKKFQRDNGLQYQPEQILVSCGGKHSFYNLCQTLLDKGDEVIIPAPYWVSYPDMVMLADATPVFITADMQQSFKITPAQLEETISPKTRLFVINSPSNPTGAAYSDGELKVFAKVLLDHPQIFIASDDMYEHLMYDGHRFCNILNVCPELYDRTVLLNGVSKAYSMTGWRIGYAGGPETIIQQMKKIQSQSTSNPTSISQAAAEAALDGDQSCVESMRKVFEERHHFVVKALNEIDGIQCLPAAGTFYCFPSIKSIIERAAHISDDVEFAQCMLDEAEVAVVPGSAFGAGGHIRISFSTSMENLKQAVKRIAAAVEQTA